MSSFQCYAAIIEEYLGIWCLFALDSVGPTFFVKQHIMVIGVNVKMTPAIWMIKMQHLCLRHCEEGCDEGECAKTRVHEEGTTNTWEEEEGFFLDVKED